MVKTLSPGRPSKRPLEQRSFLLAVRVNRAEREKIAAAANRASLPVAIFMRQAVLEKT